MAVAQSRLEETMAAPSPPSRSASADDELLDMPLKAITSFEMSSDEEDDSSSDENTEPSNKGGQATLGVPTPSRAGSTGVPVDKEAKKAKKEKKLEKEKKSRKRHKLISKKKGKVTKKEKSMHAENSSTNGGMTKMRQKVLQAVAEYIEANASWSMSVIKQDLAEKYDWEYPTFASDVKFALQSLGVGFASDQIRSGDGLVQTA
eukprot:CAMPEP_0169131630 /NCGR_PEP_ID=MMETSP1015-20121227/38349_1 /TAXON_ID=342587 /ORGANISM="Karlodinium micrum, Strain CCMP2283" /LENGTH=203 /DNA_ID=CAMNT_0009195903 /DNA_START=56 /DNA_END=667 /DNA_ORIENTATION=-